jgi:hypothetical protein
MAGPDGALWFTQDVGNRIGRAPACGLGFHSSFSGNTLTMNFDLRISTPATFTIHLHNASGPIEAALSRAIAAIVPPQAFTMSWSQLPDLGTVTVVPQLATGSCQSLCGEWATVNTSQ